MSVLVKSSLNPNKQYQVVRLHSGAELSTDAFPTSDEIIEAEHAGRSLQGAWMGVGTIVIHSVYRCTYNVDRQGNESGSWNFIYIEHAGSIV